MSPIGDHEFKKNKESLCNEIKQKLKQLTKITFSGLLKKITTASEIRTEL